MTGPVYAFIVAYNEQVTMNKVPEKHGHVYLVWLYDAHLQDHVKFILRRKSETYRVTSYTWPRVSGTGV